MRCQMLIGTPLTARRILLAGVLELGPVGFEFLEGRADTGRGDGLRMRFGVLTPNRALVLGRGCGA
jgi:hypothetical protein